MTTVFTYPETAKMLDHSLLQPQLTDDELEHGCRVAAAFEVASVCIKPYAINLARRNLRGSGVAVGTVIGFPHGGHQTGIKVLETQAAIAEGATELDMVVNIGKVRSGDWTYVERDIESVVDAAHRGQAIVKVIFENCFLNHTQKIRLCEICGKVGADFVKTSTGYGDGGAMDDDLQLMRTHSPSHVQVKAAGGVRTLDRLLQIRDLGVSRIGSTATAAILQECRRRLNLDEIALDHRVFPDGKSKVK